MDEIKSSKILNRLWEICYNSNRWKKWVNKNFDPLNEKVQLIKICGHYVLSSKELKVLSDGIKNPVNFNFSKFSS